MREICPACGAEMRTVEGTFTFEREGKEITLSPVEELKCPKCGQVTFTPEQLRKLHSLKLEELKKEAPAA